MSKVAIRLDKLSKSFHIGALRRRHNSLGDAWEAFLERARHGRFREKGEILWALRDVSLEIPQGTVLGIVGRNGAGKSTLLKILSRILEPTSGQAEVHGRLASLLEVGTGFHPELSGRDNVFLNGSILGMKRAEIQRKFNEIVAFAGVERFIDTPVKRYSSGMYMRLAFAVAAHLEPDILVVDEVLAVGDAEFQRKCLGKMEEVAQVGRTVIFVSHNMAAMQNLCAACVWLDEGAVRAAGSSGDVIKEYLSAASGADSAPLLESRRDRQGDGSVRITRVTFSGGPPEQSTPVTPGSALLLRLEYTVAEGARPRDVHVAVGIRGARGEPITHLATSTVATDFREIPPRGEFACSISSLPLRPGLYSATVFVRTRGGVADWIERAASFRVDEADFFMTGRLPPEGQGYLLLQHAWEIRSPQRRHT